MKSPFPGMDPFIEARGLWPDFHQRLMTDIVDLITQSLPPNYVARLGHRTYIDRIEDEAGQDFHFEPEVSVLERETFSESGTATLLSSAEGGVVVMHGTPSETEVKEVYLDIFDMDPEKRLVTSIEVLSPANKRYGGTGWRQYSRKRDLFFLGRANLVEIDLLRGERRRTMREPWPDSPYYVLVTRMWTSPACHVWTAFATRPLPKIPIPLRRGDQELILPLQACVDRIYENSRYWRDAAYDQPIRPALNEPEAALVFQHLQQQSP